MLGLSQAEGSWGEPGEVQLCAVGEDCSATSPLSPRLLSEGQPLTAGGVLELGQELLAGAVVLACWMGARGSHTAVWPCNGSGKVSDCLGAATSGVQPPVQAQS